MRFAPIIHAYLRESHENTGLRRIIRRQRRAIDALRRENVELRADFDLAMRAVPDHRWRDVLALCRTRHEIEREPEVAQ